MKFFSTTFLLLSLLLFLTALPAWGTSNFVRVPLGKGASIEVPKNWVDLSGNQRTTIDSYVEAKESMMSYRQYESTLSFAANLYDDRGNSIALVNARFYPDNPFTQAEARQVTSTVLKELDVELRKGYEQALKAAT